MVTMDTPQGNADRLMTTEEVAAYLGYAVQTIYNKVHAGVLPVMRLETGALRFRRSAIDEWLQRTAKESDGRAAA